MRDILRSLVETSDCFIYQILRLNVFLQKHNATENVSSTATILIVEFLGLKRIMFKYAI